MKKISKLIACVATSTLILALPVLAQAQTLTIANGTDNALTFSVNNVCATKDIGTIFGMEVKTISADTMNKLCNNFAAPCEIKGFDGKNCSGKFKGGLTYENANAIMVNGGEGKGVVHGSIGDNESSLFYK